MEDRGVWCLGVVRGRRSTARALIEAKVRIKARALINAKVLIRARVQIKARVLTTLCFFLPIHPFPDDFGPRCRYESADIIAHLYKNYGPGEAPEMLTGAGMTFGAAFSLIPRFGKGSAKSSDAKEQPPAKPLTVWGYEASPFSKVRGLLR